MQAELTHFRCREIAMQLHGPNYQEKIIPYKFILQHLGKVKSMALIPTAYFICSQEPVKSIPEQAMMYMAAAAELEAN